MRKSMTLIKKHAGVVAISLATLLLLFGAAAFLSNTEIFSAKAEKDAVTSESDIGSEEEIAVPGDLYARATADLSILADEGETIEIPFRITHKVGDQDSPVVTSRTSLPTSLLEGLSINGTYINGGAYYVNSTSIDSTKDYDGGEYKFSPGDNIMFMPIRQGRHYLDEGNFRVYYISNGVETDISSTNYGSYLAKKFTVPEDIPADAEIVINAPYINLPDARKADIHSNKNLQVTLEASDSNNHLDYIYWNEPNAISGNTRGYIYNDTTAYLQAGGKINISGESRYSNAQNNFSLKSIKMFSADENGDFTVDESSLISYDGSTDVYTLTMPDKDVLIDIEAENHLKKTEVVVNSPGNKCSSVSATAGTESNYNSYSSYGFLFASPEEQSGQVILSAGGGTFYTYPVGAQAYSTNARYIYRLQGNITNSDAAAYTISYIKVEKIDESGNVLEDITDSEELGLRYGYDRSSYGMGCYITTKPIDENIRITCTFEQNSAYKLYFKEYPANDGSRLYNNFYMYPLNADGNPTYTSYSNYTYSSDTVDLGKCVAGSIISYYLYAYPSTGSSWTTLKSLEIWELDENGEKVQKLDGLLPEPTLTKARDGLSYYNPQKITMPDKNILIELSYNDGYAPILVEQYVVDDDGTQHPAGSEFSAQFTATPYDFGDEPYAFTDAAGNHVNTLTAVSSDENHYQFKGRRKTTNISFKLNMPEGYTMAGFKWGTNSYSYGNFFDNITYNSFSCFASCENSTYNMSDYVNTVIFNGNYAFKFVIYYAHTNPMTVVQKTGGAVVPDNKTALGTVTLSRDDSSSENTQLAPFSDVVGSTTDASQGSIWNTAAFALLSNNQENTLGVSTGTKLKISVKPDAQRIIKSVKAYKLQGGSETEFPLTASGVSYTSASYTSDELVPADCELRLEVEYAVADKIKVEVLCTDDNGNLVSNTTDASVIVTGSGALTSDGAFQEIDGSKAWLDSFTVTTDKTVSTIGNTKLDIAVDLPADSGYVLANVYAFQMDSSGSPSGETSPVTPNILAEAGGFQEVRDYSRCTFTMPGSSVLIRVYLAKTATVNVTFRARNDDTEFSTDKIPDVEGTYITYNNKSTAYGTKSYPVIVENKYNVGSYTLTKSPAQRTVDVLEKSNITGTISFPRGYVIASVEAEEIKNDSTKTAMTYSFSNAKFATNDAQYLYQADFNLGSTITAGYTYNITVNLEKAAGVKFESYHSSENCFVPNKGQSSCIAELYGERVSANPAYASVTPFAQGRANTDNDTPESAGPMSGKITANYNRSSYDYYVLQDTTLSLTAKPIEGEVVSDVKAYFENDPQTLIKVTETAKDDDGTVHYSIPQKTKLSDVMVVEVYFSTDLSGSITIINVTTDGSPLPDTCYTELSMGNNSYPNPVYDVTNDTWPSSPITSNAANTEYKIMTNSSGSVRAVAGSGYILESCEIRYHDEDEYRDLSSTSSSSRSKSYVLRASDFTGDKKITIVNTYRPGADIVVYQHRDLNEAASYNVASCLFTASNPDTSLPDGPLYINNRSYTDEHTACANKSYYAPTDEFMVAKASSVSLTVSEPRNYGYTLDRIELRKDGEPVETKYRSDLAPSVDGKLSYSLPGVTEQLTGEGYRVDIYYKADYVDLIQECVAPGNIPVSRGCKRATVTFYSAWTETNPMIQERVSGGESAEGQLEGTVDDNNYSLSTDNITVGLLDGTVDYKVVIEPDADHRVQEIWYGASRSTMKQYESLPELTWGESYTFEDLDELGVADMRYMKIIYEDIVKRDSDVTEIPPVEKNRGLLTVNVYEESDDGYKFSADNQVKISFNPPGSEAFDYAPRLYENEAFANLEPSEENANVYYFNLPYKGSGSEMFSVVENTYVDPVATPNTGYRLEKVVLINQSKGTSEEKIFARSSDNTYHLDGSKSSTINMATGNWSLNFYFSKPTLEIGTNNTAAEPKGSVDLNDVEAVASTEYMKAFKFDSGTDLILKATPLDGYEFAYILTGSSRTNMTVLDSSKITVNADGTADIDFGELYNDAYVQIQYRSITDTAYSQINIAHYKEDESGSYVLSTEGRVHVSGTHSNIPEPFLVDGSTADYVDLTTEGQITTEAASGTKLTASVTPPENCIISDFKAMYYDENGQAHDIEYTKTGNSYDLSQAVVLNSTVFIEVYYQSGYRIYYHGSGCSGTVPSDETVYYSGESATVLGKGEMLKEHNSFLGWSTMSGKNSAEDVEYNEGDTITFSSGDIHLYAVWEEEASYRVVYYADDKESGSVPIDGQSYYLNQEAVVLDNPEANPLKKTGYTFAGWSLKKADDTSVACNAGDNVRVIADNLTTADGATEKAVNLYAVWNENSYTLTYDKNTTDTVTDMPDPLSVSWKYTEVGGKLTLSESVPKRTGYTFKEWSTKAGGDGDSYAAKAEITKTAADITLYAIWTENSYTLDYQTGAGHGSAVIPEDEENLLYTYIREGHALSSQIPTDTGYTFAGWQVNGVDDRLNAGANVPFASFDNDSKTATAVATWTLNKHWVKYEITIPSDISYTKPGDEEKSFGETVAVAAEPTGYDRDKYTFSGWSSTDVTIDASGSFTMPDKDVIIRGSFTENGKVTLIYDANGATSGTAPDSVSQYTKVVEIIKGQGDLLRTGYTFDGWNASPDGNSTVYAVDTTHTFTQDTKIYAKWIPNEYHVRYYDVNGDELTDLAQTHNYGTDFTVRPKDNIPSVTGKEIVGWKFKDGMDKDADGTTITGSGTYKMPAGDVEFQAEYNDLYYTVTYQVSNAPSSYQVPETKSYKYNDAVTVADVPNITGYNFIGWKCNQVDVSGTSFTMPAENVLITGVFTEKDKVTLTYDANGATSGTVPASVTDYDEVVENIKGNVGSLEKTGYTFDGWKDANGTAYTIGAEYTFTQDTVLYAQWKKASFKVEYYEADGTTLITTHAYGYKDLVSVGSGVTPTIGDGKIWNGEWTLVNTAQRDADNVEIGTRNNYPMPAETVKYKAVLETKTYTVTYVMEGDMPGDLSYTPPAAATYNHGDTVNVDSVPTGYDTSEYKFTGWDYNGSGTYYAGGTSNASFTITENVVLKGVWEKLTPPTPNNVTVTYISGVTGNDITDSSLNITRTEQVIIGNDYTVHDNEGWTNYVRPGYRFVNWKVAAPDITGSSLIDNLIARFAGPANLGQTFSGGDTVTALSESITLEAQWAEVKYTVTYDANGATGGTVPTDDNEYSYNEIATVKDSNDLVKDGFVFKEWNTQFNGNGTAYSPDAQITMIEDVTLYAIWKTEPSDDVYYTVKYDGNGATGGSVPQDNTNYLGGESVTVFGKGNLTKTDCTFKEWNTKANGTGTGYSENDVFTMPTSDVTLYAIWLNGEGEIVSPGTGESALGVQIAVSLLIISILAGGGVVMATLRKRRENKDC